MQIIHRKLVLVISHCSLVTVYVSQVATHSDVPGRAQQEVGEDGEESRVEAVHWYPGSAHLRTSAQF